MSKLRRLEQQLTKEYFGGGPYMSRRLSQTKDSHTLTHPQLLKIMTYEKIAIK